MTRGRRELGSQHVPTAWKPLSRGCKSSLHTLAPSSAPAEPRNATQPPHTQAMHIAHMRAHTTTARLQAQEQALLRLKDEQELLAAQLPK